MNRSLSYILPVNNVQSQLANQVELLLEMLSELTPWFELLIVDEGSTDDTTDVARELAQRYPQVNVICSAVGEPPDIIDSLSQLGGEVVMVADRQSMPEAHELRELWKMRNDPELVMARLPRGPQNLSEGLLTRLMSWGDALRDAGRNSGNSNVRMLRRSAMLQMSGRPSPAAEFAY